MKKRILISAITIAAMTSCMNIEDIYYGKEVDPNKRDTLIVDDSGIVWKDAADYGTKTLIDNFYKVDNANFVSTSPNYHFTSGVKGKTDSNNNYWPQAHAMDVLIDAYLRAKAAGNTTEMAKYKLIFDNAIKAPMGNGSVKVTTGIFWTNFGGDAYRQLSPVFGNQLIDDMEWHALTLIRLYEATAEPEYLREAQKLFEQIWTGWNVPKGLAGDGGLVWDISAANKTKNACSNGPGALVALRLHQMKQRAQWEADALAPYKTINYLGRAESIYSWLKAVLYDKNTGAVYDNVASNGSLNRTVFTYNTGTFIGAAYLLYKFTKNADYLADAINSTNYTTTSLTVGGILKDEGGNGDLSLFKGIFVRYAAMLVNDESITKSFRTKLYDILKNNAVTLWRNGLDFNPQGKPISLFTPDWTVPQSKIILKGSDYQSPLLGWQVSGATLMEAVVAMKDPRK